MPKSPPLAVNGFATDSRTSHSGYPLDRPQVGSVRHGQLMRFPKIKTLFYLLAHFRFGEVLRKVRGRLHSRTVSFGLRRNLLVPFEAPTPKIPITIRPLREEDIPFLLEAPYHGVPKKELIEQAERLSFLREGIPTCYVAVTQDGKPCFMQWLMSSEDNDKIQLRFNHGFPLLAPDEALVEKCFTPEAYRGLGIMSYAMALIAKKAERLNARRVITFVEVNNIASLKGCKKSGFVPYIIRDDRWFLFRRKLTWTSLPQGFLYPFETAAVTKAPKEKFRFSESTSPQLDNVVTHPAS